MKLLAIPQTIADAARLGQHYPQMESTKRNEQAFIVADFAGIKLPKHPSLWEIPLRTPIPFHDLRICLSSAQSYEEDGDRFVAVPGSRQKVISANKTRTNRESYFKGEAFLVKAYQKTTGIKITVKEFVIGGVGRESVMVGTYSYSGTAEEVIRSFPPGKQAIEQAIKLLPIRPTLGQQP